MSDILIKRMETFEEIEGKAKVHYQAWQQTYRGQLPDAYLDQMSIESCLAVARRWTDNVIIAKDGEKVIGFAAYGAYQRGRNETEQSGVEMGEIYGLYLLQEYQKKGIGYRLMSAAMDQLTNYSIVALWVLKDNQKAIPFYLRYGFRFDGEQKQLLIGDIVHEQRMIFSRET